MERLERAGLRGAFRCCRGSQFCANAGWPEQITEIVMDMSPAYIAGAAAAITEKTRAILPVHLYGKISDMAALSSLAAKYRLRTVEDCAQGPRCGAQGRDMGRSGGIQFLSHEKSWRLGRCGGHGDRS